MILVQLDMSVNIYGNLILVSCNLSRCNGGWTQTWAYGRQGSGDWQQGLKRGKLWTWGENFSVCIHCFPWGYKVISLQHEIRAHTQGNSFKIYIVNYYKLNELSFYGGPG